MITKLLKSTNTSGFNSNDYNALATVCNVLKSDMVKVENAARKGKKAKKKPAGKTAKAEDDEEWIAAGGEDGDYGADSVYDDFM
jgi:hypothetical protein